ncbi:hypothetical protein Ccrd_001089 [Cynara cardunculus var. scolymus]|uniref:FAR1 DNA binding domain-containing protein n=1 Tax=Cynara cardunculus var. scolymus TaxID=59895 RepID=A0A118JY29_CYNCS|nr:hypothetical protein Ccrd_001089 [Cynara cardunculus var. scolymus]
MEVVTLESNEDFDMGLSLFKKVPKNCEEIVMVEDIETHGMDDTTGNTSNNEIQNDENPEHALSISPGGTNWYTPVVEEVVNPIIGSVYPSLDVGESVYQKYAETAGFKVVRNLKESTIVCSCNHISRHGYLWRRNLIPIELQNSRQRICDVGEDQRRIINDKYDIIDDVLDILRDDKEKLESFVATLKEMRDDVAKDRTYEPSMKHKERGIEQILGFIRPDNIEIHPATGIRNKGCGTSKRLIGATVKSSSPKRMCSGCKLMSNHNIRNCPTKTK